MKMHFQMPNSNGECSLTTRLQSKQMNDREREREKERERERESQK